MRRVCASGELRSPQAENCPRLTSIDNAAATKYQLNHQIPSPVRPPDLSSWDWFSSVAFSTYEPSGLTWPMVSITPKSFQGSAWLGMPYQQQRTKGLAKLLGGIKADPKAYGSAYTSPSRPPGGCSSTAKNTDRHQTVTWQTRRRVHQSSKKHKRYMAIWSHERLAPTFSGLCSLTLPRFKRGLNPAILPLKHLRIFNRKDGIVKCYSDGSTIGYDKTHSVWLRVIAPQPHAVVLSQATASSVYMRNNSADIQVFRSPSISLSRLQHIGDEVLSRTTLDGHRMAELLLGNPHSILDESPATPTVVIPFNPKTIEPTSHQLWSNVIECVNSGARVHTRLKDSDSPSSDGHPIIPVPDGDYDSRIISRYIFPHRIFHSSSTQSFHHTLRTIHLGTPAGSGVLSGPDLDEPEPRDPPSEVPSPEGPPPEGPPPEGPPIQPFPDPEYD